MLEGQTFTQLGTYEFNWTPYLVSLEQHCSNVKSNKSAYKTERLDPSTLRPASMFTYYMIDDGLIIGADKDFKWVALRGDKIMDQVPIAKKIEKLFKEQGVNVRPMFLRLEGFGTEHVDMDSDCCGFNIYPKNDPAETFIRRGDVVETYPTLANSVWLVNNTNVHWITNKDIAKWFHIRIYCEYERAKRLLLEANLFK